jgi:hypothetical protein
VNSFCKAALLFLVATAAAGCANLGTPSLCGEGPARDQRARAQFYDPYPETVSAPEITGTRPREFDQPFSPPLQTQLERWDATRQQAGP